MFFSLIFSWIPLEKLVYIFLDLVDKFLFYAMFRMFLLQKLYTIYRFEVETGIFGALSSWHGFDCGRRAVRLRSTRQS